MVNVVRKRNITKIDGYTYTQFKKMMSDCKRLSVSNKCAMPRWGSEEFKTKTTDEWVQWAKDNYEEDMKLPSLQEMRTWTQEQKEELKSKMKAQPVKKSQ